MAAISQMTFSNAYSNIGLDNGLAPTRRQVIIGTNVEPVHQRTYSELGRDELMAKRDMLMDNIINDNCVCGLVSYRGMQIQRDLFNSLLLDDTIWHHGTWR